MPWYRVPLNFVERVRATRDAAADELTPAQRQVLDLVAGRNDDELLLGGSMVHFNFGRSKNNPARCSVCGWMSARLCDFKIAPGVSCDRPLCEWCTHSPAPEKDLCPEHVQRYKAWLAGRTNSTDGEGA